MLKRMFLTLSLVLALAVSLGYAESPAYEQLFSFLNSRFPASHQVISQVAETFGDRMAFPAKGARLERGRELLVLNTKSGIPIYLLPQGAVIRVETSVEDKILAQQMALLGDPPVKGDPVVIPGSPVIYFYTNIEDKNTQPPYQDLMARLLENNFEVVEVYGTKLIPKTDRYGLLLRLEGVKEHLVCKV